MPSIQIKQLDTSNEEYKFSKEQKAELDRRFSDYQNGIGKTYTWDEAVIITDQALADKKIKNKVMLNLFQHPTC